jgi:ubiquinone biosynthesis protein UbiJ
MAGSKLLPELCANLLEDAGERFLRLAPDSPKYLAPLAGKTIALRFVPPGLNLYLLPTAHSLRIQTHFEATPDAMLSGSPLAFARLELSEEPRRSLFAGEVKIEGDMEVARAFQTLFERLNIDWESWLAQFVGQSLAETLMDVLRSSRDWRRESLEAMRLNIAEYLQEETRDLPAVAEAEQFFDEVDEVRAGHDRLEARIRRLEIKASDHS